MRYKEWAQEVGFQDVQEVRFKWPINTWPKDDHYKMLGQLTMVNLSSELEGFCELSVCPGIATLSLTPRQL